MGELALSSGGLAEDVLAVIAGDDCLGVAEDNRGAVAALASHVHEVGVRGLNQTLELVALLFVFVFGVKKVALHCGEI
jgi:hypothetical protein